MPIFLNTNRHKRMQASTHKRLIDYVKRIMFRQNQQTRNEGQEKGRKHNIFFFIPIGTSTCKASMHGKKSQFEKVHHHHHHHQQQQHHSSSSSLSPGLIISKDSLKAEPAVALPVDIVDDTWLFSSSFPKKLTFQRNLAASCERSPLSIRTRVSKQDGGRVPFEQNS